MDVSFGQSAIVLCFGICRKDNIGRLRSFQIHLQAIIEQNCSRIMSEFKELRISDMRVVVNHAKGFEK
jgi:hypothetical protein